MGKKHIFILAFFSAVILLTWHVFPVHTALPGTRLITPDGREIFSFKGDTTYIGKTPYSVQRWGPDRLKLTREGTDQGVFLKRLGAKLMIRDLKGNLLHIIRKEGWIFRVESPIGARLALLEVSPKKAKIFREEGKPLLVLSAGTRSVTVKNGKGKTVYILKGDAEIYPACFLCLPALTKAERAACYLLYKVIPLNE